MNETITIPDPGKRVVVVIQSKPRSSPPNIVRSRANLFNGQVLVKPVKPDDLKTGKRNDVGTRSELVQPGVHLIVEGGADQSTASNTDYNVWLEFYQDKTRIHESKHKKGDFKAGTPHIPFRYNCTFQ